MVMLNHCVAAHIVSIIVAVAVAVAMAMNREQACLVMYSTVQTPVPRTRPVVSCLVTIE